MAGLPDLAASLGSACHAGQEAISPVLAAAGVGWQSLLRGAYVSQRPHHPPKWITRRCCWVE